MLLEHVKNINFVDEELEAEFTELTEAIATMLSRLDEDSPWLGKSATDVRQNMPQPGMADADVRNQEEPVRDDVIAAMDNIIKQMEAAKNAMVILNQMSDSPSRTKNRSRVMGNLNRIRGSFQRVTKMMQGTSMEDEYQPAY